MAHEQQTRRLTFAQWMDRHPNVDERWQWTVKRLYEIGGAAVESRYVSHINGVRQKNKWYLNEGIHIVDEDGTILARAYYKPERKQPYVLDGARVRYFGQFKNPSALADKVLDLADDRWVRTRGLLR